MADKTKFLSTAGVGRLWKNVVKKVSSSVAEEKTRAEQEEARLEEKIDSIVIAGSDFVEGDGIDISVDESGQKVIQLENNSINDAHIDSISFSKVTLKDGDTLILHGGHANG